MIKRIQQLTLVLLVLLLAYFATFSAAVRWLQIAPNQVVWVVQKLTGAQVGFKGLKLEQTWLGVNIELQGFAFTAPEISLKSDIVSLDYNLWSPFFYGMPLGNKLYLEGLDLKASAPLDTEPSSKAFAVENLKSPSLRYLWKKVHIKNANLSLGTDRQFGLKIDSFQSIKGLHWRTLGEFSMFWNNQPEVAVQFKSDFTFSFMGFLSDGSLTLDLSKPILIEDWLPLLPEKWQEVLPRGELLGRLQVSLAPGDELNFLTEVNAQQLVWLENDEVMPKSMGLEFKFAPNLKGQTVSLSSWDFTLDSLRLDNAYVEAHSPIKLSLKEGTQLDFLVPSLSVKPFLPIIQRFLQPAGLDSPLIKEVEFDVALVKGVVELDNLELSQFDINFARLNVPSYKNSPAFSAKDLQVSFLDNRFDISTTDAILVQHDSFRVEPLNLILQKPLVITRHSAAASWHLEQQALLLDTAAIEVTASLDSNNLLDLSLSVAVPTLKEAKTFIPYPMMEETLQTWLRGSLVEGGSVKGSVVIQGNVEDFPFKVEKGAEPLGKFIAELEIYNTELKFDPGWPSIRDFKANLTFTPYKLVISTDKAKMLEADLSKVVVVIDDLDSDNIAVDIQGVGQASFPQALNLLAKSPLLKMVGIDEFVANHLETKGGVTVDLPKIWIPVVGYDERKEEVSGKVTANDNDIVLFDKVKLSKLKGEVFFTEKTVEAKQLKGVFSDGVFSAGVSTQDSGKTLALKFKGDLKAQGLITELLNIESPLTGVVPWTLNALLPLKGDRDITLESTLSLNQVNSQLPKPLESEFFANTGQSLKALLSINKQSLSLHTDLSNWGGGYILWDLETTKLSGFIAELGLGARRSDNLFKSFENQYEFKAKFDELNLTLWQNWIQKSFSAETKVARPSQLPGWMAQKSWKNSRVEINKLSINAENTFEKANLRWQYLKTTDELIADFISQQGNIYFKKDQQKNDTILVQDLTYNITPADTKEAPAKVCTPWQTFGVNKASFTGERLSINGKSIDLLTFQYEDTIDTRQIDNIKLNSNALGGGILGEYRFDKSKQLSKTNLTLNSRDVVKLSSFLEIKQGFTGKEGWIKANLDWVGSLDCFKLANLDGNIEFKVVDGVIKNAEPGLARLLGLLSIESLARRLKLDVEDVTKAGLTFDSISGKGNFLKGELSLKDFKLSAPSASADLFGKVNLVSREVALDVRITPTIGSTLPIVAAISGVATPIAGVLAYALMKAIPAINEDLVTYRYNVSGTIEEPVIEDKGLAIEILNTEKREANDQNILDY